MSAKCVQARDTAQCLHRKLVTWFQCSRRPSMPRPENHSQHQRHSAVQLPQYSDCPKKRALIFWQFQRATGGKSCMARNRRSAITCWRLRAGTHQPNKMAPSRFLSWLPSIANGRALLGTGATEGSWGKLQASLSPRIQHIQIEGSCKWIGTHWPNSRARLHDRVWYRSVVDECLDPCSNFQLWKVWRPKCWPVLQSTGEYVRGNSKLGRCLCHFQYQRSN